MKSRQPESGLSFERVVFFSDAVFAIVITLLVLEIKTPHLTEHSESALNHALLELLPRIIGFIISFLIVGLMWIEHHRIFRYIAHYDGGLLWRNLLLLLFISFVPFPTALFSENYWSRTAFILYTSSFAAVGLMKFWVWVYAAGKANLLEAGTEPSVVTRIKRRSLAVPIACGVAIILAIFSVRLAPFGFALIPLIAKLLDPTRKRVETSTDTEVESGEPAT